MPGPLRTIGDRVTIMHRKDDLSAGVPVPSSVTGKFIADASEFTPGECVNCGAPAIENHLLFCGERCRQVGELVRYARRKIADSEFERPDVAEAIAIRKSQLILGFYDKRARKVPAFAGNCWRSLAGFAEWTH